MVYRLYLKNIKSCYDWISRDTKEKVQDINDEIIRGIKRVCNNIIQTENIIGNRNGHGYKCNNNEDDHVLYHALLLNTSEANTTELVSCLDQWIKDPSTVTVLVDGLELGINKDCSGVKDDQTIDCPANKLGMGYRLAIGFGVSLVIVLIILVIILVIVKRRYNIMQTCALLQYSIQLYMYMTL